MFATLLDFAGNLPAAAGVLEAVPAADALCQQDANAYQPGTRTYRALLTDGAVRVPPGMGAGLDWVLRPDTAYIRYAPGGGREALGTTTSLARFDFPPNGSCDTVPGCLLRSVEEAPNPVTTQNLFVWTGLSATWEPTTAHCESWKTDTGSGTVGQVWNRDRSAISAMSLPCTVAARLICVEQPAAASN